MKRVRPASRNSTTHTLRQAVTRSLLTVALAGTAPLSFAGADIKIGDDAGISLGMGLRSSYTSAQRGAPNGTHCKC
mgnify:FL=1|jgi:hypothetical protein